MTSWKKIKNFNNYLISDDGRIYNIKRKKLMKQSVDLYGYQFISLWQGKEYRYYNKGVHRLVGETFLNRGESHTQVNHLDENKQNNHVNNLNWVTASENTNWGTRNDKVSKALGHGIVILNKKTNSKKEYQSLSKASLGEGKCHSYFHNMLKKLGITENELFKIIKYETRKTNG